jgi:Uncharacterised protein family (UPF0236)
MTPSERDRLIEAMVERYRAVLEQRVPRGPKTLDEIEQTVEEVSVEMERELERRILEQQESLPAWPENQARCACGALARFRQRRPRLLVTRHGEGYLERRYYYCAACRRGFAPLDQQLGLDRGVTTTQVRVWVATLGAYLPFAQAAIALEQLTGVRLGPSTVERVTVAVGASVRQANRQRSEQHRKGALAQPSLKPQRLYIGMDGKMVPLREAWKRDGSAGELTCRWAECKAGVIYQALSGPQGDRGVDRRAYVATLAKAAPFGQALATVAHEQGMHWAKEVVVLGDGAAWIWQIAGSQFPEATQIVDFFHASEHLWAVAREWFGPESAAAKTWVAARQQELRQDDVAGVLAALRAWKPRKAERRKLRKETLHYFASNQERMRYGTFIQHGYHIGSGVVEATCKQVVGSRLDQAGMHWREASAEAVVTLRAALLSTDYLDLRPHCAAAH